MNPWNQIPLLRLLIPFIAGIALALWQENPLTVPAPVFLALAVPAFIIAALPARFIRYRWRWVFGLICSVLFCVAGYQLTCNHNDRNDLRHFCRFNNGKEACIAQLAAAPVIRENSVKAVAYVGAVQTSSGLAATCGRLLLYFQKESRACSLRYGDRIVFLAPVTEIRAPGNPSQFNYRRYLSFRGIYHQAYVRTVNWKVLDHEHGNILMAKALDIRERLMQVFRDNHVEGREYAVASAILLGYTDDLDTSLLRDYASTGAMHILSVSGLHVGIIFLVFSLVLSFLDKMPKARHIKPFLLVLLVWMYGLLSGLSPSVLRSCAMISFLITGNSLGRPVSIFNTMAASAFLLLVINPCMVADVGFQLSYIAVTGIVVVQKNLSELWSPGNYLLRKIWEITAISLAAQLLTFPLTLLYFRQFPNYFLLTNILVIPLSTLVLYGGILVLATAPLEPVCSLLARIFDKMVFLMNHIISTIGELPFAVTGNISVTIPETVMIYLMIFSGLVFLFRKKRSFLWISLSLCIMLSMSLSARKIRHLEQKSIVVCSLPHAFAMDLVLGTEHFLVADSSFLGNEALMAFHLKNGWIDRQLGAPLPVDLKSDTLLPGKKLCPFFRKGPLLQFCGKRIIIVDQGFRLRKPKGRLHADCLVMTGNPAVDIRDLLEAFEPDAIIFSSSNSWKKIKKWNEECKVLNRKGHSVPDQGAFVLDF